MVDPVILAQVILQGLMIGAVYALISLGMTLIFSTTGLLNFTHGSFLAVAIYMALSLHTAFKLDPYLSVFITTPLLFVFGWVLFRTIVWRVLRAHILMAAQICLGMLWMIESVLSTVYGGDVRSVPSFLGSARAYLGPLVISAPYVVASGAAMGVGGALYLLLQRTDFGRSVRALIQNREAALLMGIRVDRTQTAVFSLGLALLGFAGPVISPMLPVTPFSGLHFTLFAFVIMIFGGTGNFIGSVVGGLMFGVLEFLARFFFTGNVAAAIPYFALVVVLLVRPRGLLGEK